jgi:cation diffusion facilitator CzcD-associated flavoprotein CzcO
MPEVKTLGGAKVLVVGGGHSAATVIRELAHLPGTGITWAVRKPVIEAYERIKDDPLPERGSLLIEANRLARSTRIRFRPNMPLFCVLRSGLKLALLA